MNKLAVCLFEIVENFKVYLDEALKVRVLEHRCIQYHVLLCCSVYNYSIYVHTVSENSEHQDDMPYLGINNLAVCLFESRNMQS